MPGLLSFLRSAFEISAQREWDGPRSDDFRGVLYMRNDGCILEKYIERVKWV